jgi:hypothetical protein
LGVAGGEDVVGRDMLEWPAVDRLFLLQGRGKRGIGSLACRRWGGLSEASGERLLAASAEAGRARFGWLNFLNKRGKDIGTE